MLTGNEQIEVDDEFLVHRDLEVLFRFECSEDGLRRSKWGKWKQLL